MQIEDQRDGVIIGALLGYKDGAPLVVFASNPSDHAVPARSLTQLSADDVGCEVALLFEDGKRDRPLIVGRIVEPVRADDAASIVHDGQFVKIEANERIELRCGKSCIILDSNGNITIRGKQVVNHASAANRIRGGSVSIN